MKKDVKKAWLKFAETNYDFNLSKLFTEKNIPEEFLEEIVTSYEYSSQKCEILHGFESGLTLEQIKLYAKPEFSYHQMRQIRFGFENGLTNEQVSFYAKLKYDSSVMNEIREGFENGLDFIQVSFYINSDFTENQMREIRLGFQNKLTDKQITFYAKSIFDSMQMKEIRSGFETELTFEQVALYANPKFSSLQMEIIKRGIGINPSMELVKVYAEPQIPFLNMNQIFIAITEESLTAEQLEVMTNPDLKESHLKVIREGFKNGLTIGQVKLYAKPEFSANQMIYIKNGLLGKLKNCSKHQLELIINSKFTDYQLREIIKGFDLDLTYEQVQTYAKSEIPWRDMQKKRNKILCQELKQTLSEEY